MVLKHTKKDSKSNIRLYYTLKILDFVYVFTKKSPSFGNYEGKHLVRWVFTDWETNENRLFFLVSKKKWECSQNSWTSLKLRNIKWPGKNLNIMLITLTKKERYIIGLECLTKGEHPLSLLLWIGYWHLIIPSSTFFEQITHSLFLTLFCNNYFR